MSESMTKRLEALLASGTDNAMLRYSLGGAYLEAGEVERATEHLARAVSLDRRYSAAWKLYAKSLALGGRSTEAAEAYRRGIAVAEEKGDLQAAKEMRVFLRRLEKEQ